MNTEQVMVVKDSEKLLNQLINVRALMVVMSCELPPLVSNEIRSRVCDIAVNIIEDIYCNAVNDESVKFRGWS